MMDKINELLNEATKIDKEVNGEKETEKRERELMKEEKKRINYEIKNDHDTIEMPIYYWEDEETKEKHYDFEEMADALEDRIHKYLKRDVLVTIYELRNEWEEDDE
tara:strand:+ start:977 stop:1294 length:318 start_codon:yes stop_codon:yes gene_type:complete